MIVKFIIHSLLLAFMVVSCNVEQRHQQQTQPSMEITFDIDSVELEDTELKIYDKILLLFPKIGGQPTDLLVRVTVSKESVGIIYLSQGNPMKTSYYYCRLIRGNRLKHRNIATVPYKTTYQDQINVLRCLTTLCESTMGVKNFGGILFKFEDFGELNVEFTELCDSIAQKRHPNRKRTSLTDAMGNPKLEEELMNNDDFSIAMEHTTLARDLRAIFDNYDIKYIDDLGYWERTMPYNKYAAQHTLSKKYDTPHVYLIDDITVVLEKNTFDYKVKSKYRELLYKLKVKLGIIEEIPKCQINVVEKNNGHYK